MRAILHPSIECRTFAIADIQVRNGISEEWSETENPAIKHLFTARFGSLVTFQGAGVRPENVALKPAWPPATGDAMNHPLRVLDLDNQTLNALTKAGLDHVREVALFSDRAKLSKKRIAEIKLLATRYMDKYR